MISDEGILYIEPSMRVSRTPIIDKLTRKMTAALRQGTPGRRTRGFHTCGCGQRSTNVDYTLPNGQKTNALSVHYLAWHRNEVPQISSTRYERLATGWPIRPPRNCAHRTCDHPGQSRRA